MRSIQNDEKYLKMTENLAHGYSSESTQRELSLNTNMIGLSCFSKDFASLCLNESSPSIGRVKEGMERMGLGLACLPGPI